MSEMMERQKTKKKDFRVKSKIFYAALMAVPVLQFIVFYIGVNINSILLAFQDIEISSDAVKTVTWTWKNFTGWFTNETSRSLVLTATGTSLKVYAITLFTGVPLGLLFSYYIYKKMPCASGFRVVLFMPSIISSIVMVLIYKYCVNDALPAIFKGLPKLLDNADTRFGVIAFYNVYVSFGTSVLMYSNKMAGISPEIIEAANLDGATQLQEFWHVVLPLTFPTISIFLITGVATLFTNQFNLYSFYGGYKTVPDSSLETLGYYMYSRAEAAKLDQTVYPPLAALGLIMTAIAVPLTFGLKFTLEKFGPSED
ncbi:MAG: sugar ABC transporter permease [Clostridia bacterium]|nr:sugar ABC transporter permease [Clostridia bacterium]